MCSIEDVILKSSETISYVSGFNSDYAFTSHGRLFNLHGNKPTLMCFNDPHGEPYVNLYDYTNERMVRRVLKSTLMLLNDNKRHKTIPYKEDHPEVDYKSYKDVAVYDVTTDKSYKSARLVDKTMRYHWKAIIKCCLGLYKTACGHEWEFIS